MGWLTGALAGLLRRSARVLPAGRRQWGEAVWAEAGQVPAGWRRLWWVAGGLWLVIREAVVNRRIGYGLGAGAVAVIAAWAVWLSWRAAPAADADSLVDRARVIVMAAALAGLPWVARRRGVFGPACRGAAIRVLRVGGCAALCALVLFVVYLDQTAPGLRVGDHEPGGAAANFSWAQQAIGLEFITLALAALLIVVMWRPVAGPTAIIAVAVGGLLALMLALFMAPFQLLIIGYAAGILAATARRSQVAPASLGIGVGAGAAASLAVYALKAAGGTYPGFGHPRIASGSAIAAGLAHLPLVTLVLGLAALAAGLLAAWRAPDGASLGDHRLARFRQGAAAGIMAGAARALLLTTLTRWWPVLFLGPLLGICAGAYGAGVGATLPRQPRSDRSWWGGVFAANLGRAAARPHNHR